MGEEINSHCASLKGDKASSEKNQEAGSST